MADIQLWIAALEIGCFFALVALAIFLVVVGADFFNFAAGPYGMAAAMIAAGLSTSLGLPFFVAAAVGVLVAIAVSVLTELVIVKPVQKKSGGTELPALVAVTATLFAIQQLVGTIFGRTPKAVDKLLPIEDIRIANVTVAGTAITTVIVTIAVFVLVATWLAKTKTGQLLRAVGDNPEAASTIGVDVPKVRIWAFALSGFVAAVAGIIFAAKSGVEFTSGLSWTLTGFLALVIGGTGKTWAPLIGGLALGSVQVFGSYYFGATGSSIAIFVVALAFFTVRPEGLFQRKVRV